MMRIMLATGLIALWTSLSFAQNLTQTLRGVLTDADSKLPLTGAVVVVLDAEPRMGTTTDENGAFRFENLPTGRISLHFSYIGYESQTISNLLLTSGKELVLNVFMEESPSKLGEIVVSANTQKGQALNEMALLSAQSISPEQTNRYAGGFNDPSRILSNFAGVTNTQDGSNDIIVRGNSPKYVQWRLEGVEISNPNHFGDQSAVGGGVSALNNNILATSDFYTGAFSPEYGDALSGVYDVKLRPGNNEKIEAVFGLGLVGTDLTLEGPFKKGYGGSFLINYRYSTIGLVDKLGLADIPGSISFQDAAFKLMLPTRKAGIFSLFGLGGKSAFAQKDVTPAFWETPGDNAQRSDINEDFDKDAYLANAGLNHSLSLSERSHIRSTFSWSGEGIDDAVFEKKVINIYDGNGAFLRDSAISRTLNFDSRLRRNNLRAAMTYNLKINPKHRIQAGTKYTLISFDFAQSQLKPNDGLRFSLLDMDEGIATWRNFVSLRSRFNERLTMVAGLHNMNVLFNQKSTLEPRIAFNWKFNAANALNLGYGSHSSMESIHNYFARVEDKEGRITTPNLDLGLLRAHHIVLGYEKRCGRNMMAKIEAYYQHLYDLPVENNDTSYYATINEGLDFRYVDLVNEGVGRNYGLELTLERFFDKGFYFLFNATVYESKYKSLEGVERNTRYNGNYLANFLIGREWTKLGKKHNKTFALNTKAFYAGGQKILPLLRDAGGNVSADPLNNRIWDHQKAYERKIEDVYQIIVSASFKWDRPHASHELFVNIDNVTNNKGKISEFYDANQPNKTRYLTQFGIFPNVLYRVYF